MHEYKITRQAVDAEDSWLAVPGVPAREIQLHTPAGGDWALHSFEHSQALVVAVWMRTRDAHPMSDVYSHSIPDGSTPSSVPAPVKTIADIPEPR